jgi:inhibitor of cysteine peptidase
MFDLTRWLFKAIILILFSFLMMACSSDNQQTSLSSKLEEVDPMKENKLAANEAPIEHLDIIMLESFPVPVNLVARGYLPNDCTMIDQITEEQSGNILTIKITTARQTDKVCRETSQVFEEVIPLDVAGLSAGVYAVKVNNKIGVFELGMDNGSAIY